MFFQAKSAKIAKRNTGSSLFRYFYTFIKTIQTTLQSMFLPVHMNFKTIEVFTQDCWCHDILSIWSR